MSDTKDKKPCPSFQFYPKDWMFVTECFSPETRGLFLVSLCFFWLSEKQGMVKNDDEMMSLDLKISLEKWQEIKRISLKKGLLVETEDDYLACPMLLEKLSEQAVYKEKQRLNGQKGGRPKNPEEPTAFFGKAKKTSSTSTSSSTSKDNPLPPEGDFPGFEKFWEAYPSYENRKAKRPECLKRWKNRNLEKIADKILLSLEAYKATESWTKENCKYIQAPLTFINSSSWEVEISTPKQNGYSNNIATPVREELSFSEKMDLKLERMMKHEKWVNRWDSNSFIFTKDLNKTGPGTIFHPVHNQIGLNDWIPVESEAVSA